MNEFELGTGTLSERIIVFKQIIDKGAYPPSVYLAQTEELLNEASAENDTESELKLLSLRAWQLYLVGNHTLSTELYDELLERCKREGRKIFLPWLYLAIGRMHSTEQRDKQALEYIELCQKAAEEINDDDTIAESNILKGITLAKSQQYAQALEAYNNAARYSSHTLNARRMGTVFFLITQLHYHCENFEDAKQACELSIQYFTEAENIRGKVLAATSLAAILNSLKQTEAALVLLHENEPLVLQLGLPYIICGFYAIKAEIFLSLSHYTKVEELIHIVEENTELTNNPRNYLDLYYIKIRLYIQTVNLNEAKIYLRKAFEITEQTNDKHWQLKLYKLESEICELEGRYQDALANYILYHEKEKLISHEISEERLSMIKISHELIEKENEKELYRLRSEKLQLELVNKSTHLASESEAITRIRSEILDILSQPTDAHTVLRAIKRKMKELPTSAVNWEEYDAHFNAAHPEFSKHLSEKHPSLSQTEIKICTLLKVGLTSREIANMLALSIRSIENHRFRIRKKLDISDKNITQVLNSL